MIKTIQNQTPSLTEEYEKISEQETLANVLKVLPVCSRCAQVPKQGLYDGFRVRGMFICSDCQLEMFAAEPGSPEYQEFLFLVKGVLCRGNS